MDNVIALAVLNEHSSCSETSVRPFSRIRVSHSAALIASYQGTTVSAATHDGRVAFAGGMPQTDGTTKAPLSGYLTWNPPV
jgi:hypothetical protein